LAAGWLIEQCGWKGKRLARVGVYEKQSLVLDNVGGATGQDVRALAAQIQADVLEKFSVHLEVEPVFV
jgi:UDP-N-acetylmuramate dehydrogenase